jgi:aquaporin Z
VASVEAQATAARRAIRNRAVLGVEPSWGRNFNDLSHEWRRLFAELFGTFLLVLVAAGAPTVAARYPGVLSQAAIVTAPGLMVMGIILFMGLVSGAHLNPVVSLAFALRKEFPWRRIPAYLAAQLVGSVLACLVLWALVGRYAHLGATLPGSGVGDLQAMAMEAFLTMGLVSTILGTASGAQNVGTLSAIAVGGYIALAGLWSSPISGASMNPGERRLRPLLGLPGRPGSRRAPGRWRRPHPSRPGRRRHRHESGSGRPRPRGSAGKARVRVIGTAQGAVGRCEW